LSGITLHAEVPKFSALKNLPADHNARIEALALSLTTPKEVATVTPKIKPELRPS
jgi:hypothetical protein